MHSMFQINNPVNAYCDGNRTGMYIITNPTSLLGCNLASNITPDNPMRDDPDGEHRRKNEFDIIADRTQHTLNDI